MSPRLSPSHPASLRLSRNCPVSRGPQSPVNPPLINTDETVRWGWQHLWNNICDKNQLTIEWITKQRVTQQLSEPIQWRFLFWLGQVCSFSGQIEIGIEQKTRSAEQTLDILENIHVVTSEWNLSNEEEKLKKWAAARLIGLSCGDVLWISFSISQASQLSVLFRKIICPLLAVLILLLAIYKHLIPPTTGFFNCNDPTIWLPYKGDTFSTKVLISVVFISFFVFVSIIINYA